MDSADLHIIRCYFQNQESSAHQSEIQNIIKAIDALGEKMVGLSPSITLPRTAALECNICLKKVILDD